LNKYPRVAHLRPFRPLHPRVDDDLCIGQLYIFIDFISLYRPVETSMYIVYSYNCNV